MGSNRFDGPPRRTYDLLKEDLSSARFGDGHVMKMSYIDQTFRAFAIALQRALKEGIRGIYFPSDGINVRDDRVMFTPRNPKESRHELIEARVFEVLGVMGEAELVVRTGSVSAAVLSQPVRPTQ